MILTMDHTTPSYYDSYTSGRVYDIDNGRNHIQQNALTSHN